MNRSLTVLIFTSTIIFSNVYGQSYKKQFNELVSKKDTVGQEQLLQKWERSDNSDPELYVAYFNYYVNKSMKDIIEIGNNPKGEEVLQIMNTDTSKTEPLSYIYGNTLYDSKLLNKGFEYAEKGIYKYPARLDIRFGKTYMYGKLEYWEEFTKEIIKTIDYSATINNKWYWTDNKPLEDPKEFMLSSIQSYQLQLYNTNNDGLLDNMKQIAETVLKYYPDHVESLSNLSIVYLIKKNYDQALDALIIAEKLAPTDYIVLGNIAQAYKFKGDNKNAIKYYELSAKYGDEQVKVYSQEQINELKKK